MKVTDMIELAQAGYKAKDVLALHKAGYTKEMIVELSEEEPKDPEQPNEDPKPEPKDPTPDNNTIIDKEVEQDNPALQELEKLKKDNADLQANLEKLQEQKRHEDISGSYEPEDKEKNIKEFIASLM